MRMNCPKCQSSFENAIECPDCCVRLVFQTEQRSGERDVSAFAGSDAFRWKRSGTPADTAASHVSTARAIFLPVAIAILAVGAGAAVFYFILLH